MVDWQEIAVDSNTTMREVLSVIDRTRMQIAVVVDDNCHLLGTIVDGDIRRSLIRGEDLDTPANVLMNANPVTGLIDENPQSWQRAMQIHTLRHLPLLDAGNCLVQLARLETPQEPDRDNLIVIMAGGLGSRLRPLTISEPKPLLKIGTKPIIETIIENFVAQGFRNFKICINYHGNMIQDYCGTGEKWNANIEYIEEKSRLGTAGALSLLGREPELPFIVMNGDILTKVDFVRLLDFHKKQKNRATMCTREYRYKIPYGVVDLNNHQIVRIEEKPIQFYNINAGIYLLEPSILKSIPKNKYYDMTTLFVNLVKKGLRAGNFPLREYWMDIGRMKDFEQAHLDYPEQFSETG